MFVMMKKLVITEGNTDQIANKFGSEGIIEKQEGFIDLTVMEEKSRKGEKEVIIMTRWESEELWKQWEKSPAHIAGHKAQRGKPQPEYIISKEAKLYNVKALKKAVVE